MNTVTQTGFLAGGSCSFGAHFNSFCAVSKKNDVILRAIVLSGCNGTLTRSDTMKLSSKTTGAIFVLAVLAGCGVSDPKEDLGRLAARIDDSEIRFITDLKSIDGRRIKAGQSVTLRDISFGEPTSREWIFSDGSAPETGATVSKTWAEAVGQISIILKVTRAADNAVDTDTLQLQIGPVEMLNRSVFGFEDRTAGFAATSKWFSWTPNAGTTAIAIDATGGANGTERALKMTAQSNFGEFQLRPHENGREFLVSMPSNTTYVYSFYIKASQAVTLSEASFLNVKNDDPKEGWYTPFWSGDPKYGTIDVTTSWKKFTFEFTTGNFATFTDAGYADGKADNAGPFFKHFASFTGASLDVWIDEISLKPKETN
jgi:hypothetical protein